MENATKLKLNEPDVVSETIDGETVVVSLSTGSYYSLEGSATAVWNLIEAEHTIEQVLDTITQQFEGDRPTMETVVKALIEQLRLEKLIVTLGSAASELSEQPAVDPAAPKLAFVEPSLQKFSDMQELLLLDPIHEVDPQAGWPAREEPAISVEA
ncbi:MAG: PqqD family protein [Phormidesmis sp.]